MTGVNDAPASPSGATDVVEDAGRADPQPLGDGDQRRARREAGQTLTFAVTGNTNPALFSAAPAVASNGALTYTSAPNAFGTATITLVLQDNGGIANGGVNTSAPVRRL